MVMDYQNLMLGNKSKKMLEIIRVQFYYLSRPHCRVRKGFLHKLVQNIQYLHLPEEEENLLIAIAIKAFAAKKRTSMLNLRQELCYEAVDILEDYLKLKK